MITQPNRGRGIMMTSNMVPSIANTDATICICFVDGAVADPLVVLDCLEEGYDFGLAGTSIAGRSSGGADVLKRRVGVVHFFYRELKTDILKLQDLRMSKVGTKLDMPHGRDVRSFLVCKKIVDLIAM
jgi:hypothetical protein